MLSGCCISFVIANDEEVREYIKNSILSINTNIILDEKIVAYDFFQNKDYDIKIFSNMCKKHGNLVITSGFEKFANFLKESGAIKRPDDFYKNFFNIPRDYFYLANNVRMIMLVNQEEYKIFLSDACDDFSSYARLKVDADRILKEDNQKKETLEER